MPSKRSSLSKMRNFVGPRLVRCRAGRGLALAGLVAATMPAAVAGAAQAAGGAAQAAGAGAPFTVDDLVRLERITDPQLSPDGDHLGMVQRKMVTDANRARMILWLLDLAPRRAAPRPLTGGKASDSSPRWSPAGRTLYFISTRSGSGQVWRIATSGGEAQQVTDYPLDVGSLKVSPRGDLLALSMEVFPDCPTLGCTRERLDARAKDKAGARIYERVFVRHWDTWSNGTRSHLFSQPLAPGGGAGGAPVDLSRGFDADIPDKPFGDDEAYAFSPDGKALLATVDELGQGALYRVDPKTAVPVRLVASGTVEAFSAGRERVVYALASLAGPVDLYSVALRGGRAERLTDANRELLAARRMSEFEQFTFRGWNDETVYGYVVKPYGFEPAKRYPIAFVVHGGPQVGFGNLWTYRWNAQTFAGAGYALAMIDFHGTPGYGQAFTDSIRGDWGGKPLVELQKGLAAAIEKYPWLDGERACALGASYGGFMRNWLEGYSP